MLVGGDKWYDQQILDAAYASGFKYWFGNQATIEDPTRFGTTNFDYGGKHYDGHGMINIGYTEYYPLALISNNWADLKSFMNSNRPLSLVVHPKGWLAQYDDIAINADQLLQINNYLTQNYVGKCYHVPPFT